MTPFVVLLVLAADGKPDTSVIRLFDGETTFGWEIEGEGKVEKGKLILGGGKATEARVTARFGQAVVSLLCLGDKGVRTEVGGEPATLSGPLTLAQDIAAGALPLLFSVPAGKRVVIEHVSVTLRDTEALFDGKSLAGWKVYKGDPKREKSKFTVKDGVLHIKDGPGDLQSEKMLDDFVLQAEVRTNGKHLNSGIFFRCIPGEYQNGYEAQIHNDFTLSPPRKYLVELFDPKTNKKTGTKEILSAAKDYGTGAIYRRVPARKAVAKDGEWFTLTLVARGRHIATWVNGVQQVDWTDDRPERDNPRKGYRAKAGAISIQGHDPTTDLSFRNIRYAVIPRKP
jgi:hypothetical protein